MNIIETLTSCLQHFWTHPLRTSLTLLGMVIGVASLISMFGIGEGARLKVIEDMKQIGQAGLIIIQSPEFQTDPSAGESINHVLTRRDVEMIERTSSHIEMVTPGIGLDQKIAFQNKAYLGRCLGTTPEYMSIRNSPLEQGRFLLDTDLRLKKRVCVIGFEVKQKLFGNQDPIGKLLRIGEEEYTIVGLLKYRDLEGARWMNDIVLVPISTLETRLFIRDFLSFIIVKVKTLSAVPLVKDLIQRALASRYQDAHKFKTISQEEVIKRIDKSTLLLRLSQGISAAIVLIVGGIGIMNLMLVSVTERTKEIGLRKAVGAKDADILRQFLLEAVMISVIGGIFGIILGLKIGDLSSQFIAVYLKSHINSIVTLRTVWMAVVFVFLVGVFFGLYPALRAARLEPSEALSYE